MIGTALLFDLLPILTVIVVFAVMVIFVTDNSVVENTINCRNAIADLNEIRMTRPNGVMFATYFVSASLNGCPSAAWNYSEITAMSTFVFIMSPLLYMFTSIISTSIAYILFTIWFFFKKVNMWSVSKMSRLFTTLVTLLIENIPLVDLLPGTTLMVWRHVKTTQAEDKMKQVTAKNSAQQSGSRRNVRYS